MESSVISSVKYALDNYSIIKSQFLNKHRDWVRCNHMIELTLQQLETYVLPIIENTDDPNPYVQHCLEEAKMHLIKAQECLTSALVNPQDKYEESLEFYKIMFQILPIITLLQFYGPQLLYQEMEGNLSDTQSSNPSNEDNFEPATPPRHLEF
jgi:hypothetical protein